MNDTLGNLVKQNLKYTRHGKVYYKLHSNEVIEEDAMQSWCHGELMKIMNTDGKTIGNVPSSFSDERDFYNPVRCGKCRTQLEILDNQDRGCPKCNANKGDETMTTSPSRIKSLEEMMLEIIITDEGSTFTLNEMVAALKQEFDKDYAMLLVRSYFLKLEKLDLVKLSKVGGRVFYTLSSQNEAAERLECLSLGIGKLVIDPRIKGKFSNDNLKLFSDLLRSRGLSPAPATVLTLIAIHKYCYEENTHSFLTSDIVNVLNIPHTTVSPQMTKLLRCGILSSEKIEGSRAYRFTLISGHIYKIDQDVRVISNQFSSSKVAEKPKAPELMVEESKEPDTTVEGSGEEVDSFVIANQVVDLVNFLREKVAITEKAAKEAEYQLAKIHQTAVERQQVIINLTEELRDIKSTHLPKSEVQQKFQVLKEGYKSKSDDLEKKLDDALEQLMEQKQINVKLGKQNKTLSNKLKWKLENVPQSKSLRLGL